MTTESNSVRNEPGGEAKAVERERRPRPPRLGSFVTIAAALLLLFGAASRMGKVEANAALFDIDRQTESRINDEIGRLKAALTLGAVPVSATGGGASGGSLPIDRNVLPPPRQEVDVDTLRRQSQADPGRWSVSSVAHQDFGADGQDHPVSTYSPAQASSRDYPAPTVPGSQARAVDSQPSVSPTASQTASHEESYVVASGDTWVKIARRTLGDANRWRDIQKVNPGAANGLEVGMRLTIPK